MTLDTLNPPETRASRRDAALRHAAVLGSVLVVALVIVAAYLALERWSSGARRTQVANETVLQLEQALSDLRDAETGQRGFLLTGEERYLEPYHAGVRRYAEDIRALRLLTARDPEQRALLAQLEAVGAAKLAELDRTIRLRRTEGMDAALAVVRTGRGKALMDQARGVVDALGAEARTDIGEWQAAERRFRAQTTLILVGGGALAGLVALLTGLLFERYLRVQRDQTGKLRRRAREEAALAEVAARLTGSYEVEELLQQVAEGALYATQAHGAFVERVDPSRTTVRVAAVAGGGVPEVGALLPYPGSLAEEVIEHDRAEWIPSIARETRPIAGELTRVCPDCALLVVPLVSEGDALGALLLVQPPGTRPFRVDEAARARTLGDLAAIALRRVLLFRETAEQRRALEESERRFRLLVDSVEEYAIYMLDPQGRITSWNRGAERLKGYREAEVLGQHVRLFYTEEDRQRGHPEDELVQAARDGSYIEEGWRVRKDGEHFWARVVLTAVRDPDGELLGYAKVTQDLTERHRAEQARESYLLQEHRARREAESANRAKSQFLANMSHEIRTPINAIMGYADLLEMGLSGELSGKQAEQVARIRRSSGHLLNIVNDVLDLSKVEADTLQLEPRSMPLYVVASEAVQMVEGQAQQKGVRLRTETICDPETSLYADEGRTRQILLNLLGNAIKFTEPGGEITVRCRVTDHALPSGGVRREGPWAVLDVADTGIGIPPADLARIFDPFVQAESGYTRKAGGAGLGLTISRRLARLMGGEITAHSTPGRGACFSLWLPLTGSDQDVTSSAAPAQRAPRMGEVGRVLMASAELATEQLAARMRGDPALPHATPLDATRLQDHISTHILELGRTMTALDGENGDSGLLSDGAAIQHLVAERHGQQRRDLGWTSQEVQREFRLLHQLLAELLDHELPRWREGEGEAEAVLARLIERSASIALEQFG